MEPLHKGGGEKKRMKKKNKKLWNKVENTKNKWGYQNFMEYKKLDDL